MLLSVALAAPAFAQPAPPAPPSDELLLDPQDMARVEASIDRALEYLASKQNPDGSWQAYTGKNNGINAFCLLAFLGRGHVPGRGPYKEVVDRGVRFMQATQIESGLYASPNPSNGVMYEHGLATLAMIEAYGFLPSPEMRASVQRAVDLIVKAQSPTGGWRYQPVPADADLSASVMQVVALRAAQNARLDVPKETVEKALVYVKSCAVPAGGFAYQPGGGAGAARTAAGCLSMQLLGAFDDPAVAKGLEYLQGLAFAANMDGHFYYTNYYAMQAMFQAGGATWAKWHPKVRNFLLESQVEDGSWPGHAEEQFNGAAAKCYSTAVAVMILDVYLHYLPAYQR